MRHYCTYFDGNYLTRGLALHQSLMRHAGSFELTVLCMDKAAETALRKKALPGVRLLPLAELVAQYPELDAARGNRTNLEFYFTCTSWLMQHLLPGIPAGELLTYLDADLYFFASPEKIHDEIGSAPIAITPHRFPLSLAHLERYGKFNVGWVSLRNNATGMACAKDWGEKCADWCFNLLEDDRYADQKYLDAWESRFPGTISITNPGVNAAPWNIKECAVTSKGDAVHIGPHALIFYHFHALVHLGRQLYDPGLHRYDSPLTPGLRDLVYQPYLRQLQGDADPEETPELLPPARADDPRSGLAIAHLLQHLQASELDRAQRLSSIEENMSATKQTIDYLKKVEADRDKARAALDDTVAYLKSVERDSAARLESIHVLQDKLKSAYADHEHNVAYIARIHAELAAHVSVIEGKDAIIATLNEQLRLATERRPAGS
ncbi:MAG: hypothetical protein Q8J74_03835 [Candidatus Didemnitutus sp.]|nr:hypothetical protein [Candidatus Didemnitutus sp.]